MQSKQHNPASFPIPLCLWAPDPVEKEFLIFPEQGLQLLLLLTVATKVRGGYGSHSLTKMLNQVAARNTSNLKRFFFEAV